MRRLLVSAEGSSIRLWRSAFFFVPACAAAWAAGCADESNPVSSDSDAGSDATVVDSSPRQDGGGDATTGKRDCAKDVDGDGLWKHLECTGLYSSFADKTVAEDAKPYKPGIEFWSDGSEKLRWIHLPQGTKIDISDFNEWMFPEGTKLWKEFKLGGKRIETRIFHKLPDKSWAHTSYRWNADETDAVRNDVGEKLPGLGPDGGIYEIPSTGQCDTCHFGRKDQVLGFDAVGLGQTTATGQTLAKLVTDGWLSGAPPKTELAFPSSGVGGTSAAAVGWIHTNCGPCHNENTNAAASFRAHFFVRATDLAPIDGGAPATIEQLDVYTQGWCKPSSRTDTETGNPYNIISGGNPAKSLMSILGGRRAAPDENPGPGVQMPPIVSRAVDHDGIKLVNDWITSLPACL
jgi:hypothetical protein